MQGRAGFGRVLSAKSRASADGVFVRQTNLERITDLRAFLGEGRIVFAGNVTDEVKLLVQNAEGFARYCRGGKDGVSHLMLLEGLQRHRDAARDLRPFIDLGIPALQPFINRQIITQPIARLFVRIHR